MEQKFEDIVRSMSAQDIIMAMVNGLRKKWVKINMDTFGDVDWYNHYIPFWTCFGCAATNTICQIIKKKFKLSAISSQVSRAKFINANDEFLFSFEVAIDHLRKGQIDSYNSLAKDFKFAQIKNNYNWTLPVLTNRYTKEDLTKYESLAMINKP